jgi:hypothetical protein
MNKSASIRQTRRTVLRLLGTAGLFLLSPLSAHASPRLANSTHPLLPDALLDTVDENNMAARLGTYYLQSHPDEATSAFLANCMTGLNSRKQLSRRIQQEFCNGELTTVDGWLLSRTEARLYALVALYRR